jgi:hypothetical protein
VLGVKTTNTVDLGTSSLKFKDFYLAGAASIGGTLGVTGATTLSAALTYGGVTLSNAVTGTGNMVLSASPTITGTITAAAANFSGAVALNGNATIGDADTDTITQAASYVTGTQLKSAKTATNTLSLAAYDVDGTAYTNLITLTAGNEPTLALTSTGVGTINNMSIGATTASTGAFTTLSASSTVTLSGGTINGVAFLNGSNVLTTGSALTFSGTTLGLSSADSRFTLTSTGSGQTVGISIKGGAGGGDTFNFIESLNNDNTQAWYLGSNGTSNVLAFKVAGSEAMRLTSTSLYTASTINVGIGVSSLTYKFQVNGTINTAYSTTNTLGGGTLAYVSNASTTNGTDATIRFDALGSASPAAASISGVHTGDGQSALTFGTRPNGSSSVLERMRLDSSGNLGLGVTPHANVGQRTLSVANYTGTFSSLTMGSNSTSAGYIGYNMGNTNSANTWRYMTADTGSALYFAGNEMRFMLFPLGTAGATTSGTQEMTLDASGNLLVGTTSAINSGKVSVSATNNLLALKIGGTEGVMVDFRDSANDSCGSIYSIASSNSTSYNTSSDYRLKENAQPMSGALAKVSNLKPVTFTWKKSGVASQGFIAHELAEVVPECVTGEKDAVDADGKPIHQGIDTSFLVATLTAAIQEQQALITTLTARITALEGA